MVTIAQRGFVLALSRVDAVDVHFTPRALGADGLWRVVETEHLYGDNRALSTESDFHGCTRCATVRMNQRGSLACG